MESDLADQQAVKEVQAKRKQKYTKADYKRLESLMYDKFSLKLEAAQFLLGNDLESCRKALNSNEPSTVHLVERINIDFQVHNSIVPSALNLARFKVAGNLPSLRVNFSDTKYKTLMRLIDVTIPKFDDDDAAQQTQPAKVALPRPEPPRPRRSSGPLQLPFWDQTVEYNVDTDDEASVHEDTKEDDEFFEAPDAGSDVRGVGEGWNGSNSSILAASRAPSTHLRARFFCRHAVCCCSKSEPGWNRTRSRRRCIEPLCIGFCVGEVRYGRECEPSVSPLLLFISIFFLNS